MRHGFSLVELSIVLVILGLLTGGILTGQSLISAAELRSVVTEFQRYQTATQTFRDKYFALPGDMRNATEFWGAVNTSGSNGNCSAPGTSMGTGTQTCNGNGDGKLNQAYENHRFWQHLANAGLIEGTYTGTQHLTTNDRTPGINIPVSRLGSATGWGVNHDTIDATHSTWFPMIAHVFEFGKDRSDWGATDPVVTSEEAWNIDTKLDDGLPGTGKVTVPKSSAAGYTGCSTTDSASTAKYGLQSTGLTCAFKFLTPF